MRRLFSIILLLVLIYVAKPLWEGPVSQYVDLSFLQPVDEKVEQLAEGPTGDWVRDTAQSVQRHTGELVDQWKAKPEPSAQEAPPLHEPAQSGIAIQNVEIGMSESEVHALLGPPQMKAWNDYNTLWHMHHDNYHRFVMVAYDTAGRVGALYTNDDVIKSNNGIAYRTLKADVRRTLGEPLTELKKGRILYQLSDVDTIDLFLQDDLYTYVFYDEHENYQLTALLLVDEAFEQRKSSIYGEPSDELRAGYERTLFELTNAIRVRKGVRALEYSTALSDTARKHSDDMAQNEFFSHDNLRGQTPFDRMRIDGITYKSAGENLAFGQYSSIFAHEGLMNSYDHRMNTLTRHYTHLGIGVAFGKENTPYFTQNYVQK